MCFALFVVAIIIPNLTEGFLMYYRKPMAELPEFDYDVSNNKISFEITIITFCS